MTDSAPAGKKGCLRRGCFGCMIVFGAGLGLLLVMALITVIRGTPEVVREDDELTHAIPQGDWEISRSGSPLFVDPGQVGRVVLDVSMVSFSIVPEPAGTPVRLDAHYDSGSHVLEESMEPNGELGWTYRLSFGRRSSFQFFKIDSGNRLELHLPEGTPLVLEGQLGIGESRIQLGGLWVESVDLEVGVGDHRFDFDEPLAVPMKRFALDGSLGETRVDHLGNASPTEVTVRHRIGEVRIDLDGAWRNDSTVTVSSSIGGFRVGLPDDEVAFELLGASIGIGEANTRRARERPEPPAGAPLVRLKATHSLGELLLTK